MEIDSFLTINIKSNGGPYFETPLDIVQCEIETICEYFLPPVLHDLGYGYSF